MTSISTASVVLFKFSSVSMYEPYSEFNYIFITGVLNLLYMVISYSTEYSLNTIFAVEHSGLTPYHRSRNSMRYL